jgi:hypothetical protein
MFYLEYILIFLIIVSFNLHFQVRDLHSFFQYNSSPIFFGFLSLYSIYNITNEKTIDNIIFFIMNDDSGMSIFVELYLMLFALCVILMSYNFYVIYKESYMNK